MKSIPSFKTLLLGTALTVPVAFAFPALAQDQEQACAELKTLIEDENVQVDIPEEEIRKIIDANNEAECRQQVAEITAAVGMSAEEVEALSERVRAAATEQERVVVEQEVVVEGEVFVDQQPPKVDVQQQGPEISVRASQPQVTVTEQRAQIVIKQAQAKVQVEIPQPTIRIEQPAPEIVITMPESGVDVTQVRPQIEVRQFEPQVSVMQAPPSFDLELRPVTDPAASEGIKITERQTGEQMALAAEGDAELEPREVANAQVNLSQAEPVVSFEESQEQARVSIQRAEPQVRFESAEPQVEIVQVGEPQIEFVKVNDATVTIREAEGGQQQAEGEQQAGAEQQAEAEQQAGAEQQAEAKQAKEAEQATEEGQVAMTETAADTGALMVGDITGQKVYRETGEEVGELDRVIRLNDEVWAVVSAGGFLGIGDKEIPIELSRLGFGPNGEVIAEGLTDEQIEAAQNVDLQGAEALPADTELQVKTKM